jgi:hypothetical protein
MRLLAKEIRHEDGFRYSGFGHPVFQPYDGCDTTNQNQSRHTGQRKSEHGRAAKILRSHLCVQADEDVYDDRYKSAALGWCSVIACVATPLKHEDS